MRVYDYVVLWHPNESEKKKNQDSELIAEGRLLARDENSARLIAATKIPGESQRKVTQLEILVRPF